MNYLEKPKFLYKLCYNQSPHIVPDHQSEQEPCCKSRPKNIHKYNNHNL